MHGGGTVSIQEVRRSRRLNGHAEVPGDKSISHRALLLSALAEGESTISGLSAGDDVARTGKVMVQLGARMANEGDVMVVTPWESWPASQEHTDSSEILRSRAARWTGWRTPSG